MSHDVITKMVDVNFQLLNFIAMQCFVLLFLSEMLRVRSPMISDIFPIVGPCRFPRTRKILKAVPGFFVSFVQLASQKSSQKGTCEKKHATVT